MKKSILSTKKLLIFHSMNLNNYNLDFSVNLNINTVSMEWIESESKMVLRKPLERQEAESGHVTSVVKYLPMASFKAHSHPLGEEIFVLEGIFSDENGDYPAGSYLRNPPGSSHSPFSKDGCLLFVKLNQFNHRDTESVCINTNDTPWRQGHGNLEVMPLHTFETSNTALVKWPKNERFVPHKHFGGEEIFVLKGTFKDEHKDYPKGTWIRSAHLSEHHPYVDEDTIILVKTGHLL